MVFSVLDRLCKVVSDGVGRLRGLTWGNVFAGVTGRVGHTCIDYCRGCRSANVLLRFCYARSVVLGLSMPLA